MEPPGEEDGDGGPLTSTDIALNLSPAPARPIWVGYRVSGSANAGYDYTGLADAGLAITDMIGSLRIEAGTATHTIRLGIPSDLLREGTETLTLELLTPTAGTAIPWGRRPRTPSASVMTRKTATGRWYGLAPRAASPWPRVLRWTSHWWWMRSRGLAERPSGGGRGSEHGRGDRL